MSKELLPVNNDEAWHRFAESWDGHKFQDLFDVKIFVNSGIYAIVPDTTGCQNCDLFISEACHVKSCTEISNRALYFDWCFKKITTQYE